MTFTVECRLSDAERADLERTSAALIDTGADPGAAEFYDRADVGDALPLGCAAFLRDFRRHEPAAAAVVRNLPVQLARLPPTPSSWRKAIELEGTRREEAVLGLCGLALGEPFAWLTLQAGRLVQNVLPMRGDEFAQSGYGSRVLLEFHTEDGFHPQRPDYLLLLGLRNHDAVPTLIASVRDVRLPERTRRVLHERRFVILPDPEHQRQLAESAPGHPALDCVRRWSHYPEPTSVLTGDPRSPYIQLDRPFMRAIDGAPDAEAALDELMTALERVQHRIVIDPGTLVIIDNAVAVHGRPPFEARYDGTDRWLKKLLVRRDIRRFDISSPGSQRVRI